MESKDPPIPGWMHFPEAEGRAVRSADGSEQAHFVRVPNNGGFYRRRPAIRRARHRSGRLARPEVEMSQAVERAARTR